MKMLRFATLFIVFALCHNSAHGGCTIAKIYDDVLSPFKDACPPLLFPSKRFCCADFERGLERGEGYCCDEEEFYKSTVITLLVPAIAVTVGVLSLIICCVCCLCCSCCPWYRRRHRGTVYGPGVQSPTVVQVIQPTARPTGNNAAPASAYPQSVYPPAYPAHQQHTAVPMSMPEPPPSYTSEAYVKQPAYNPDYRP